MTREQLLHILHIARDAGETSKVKTPGHIYQTLERPTIVTLDLEGAKVLATQQAVFCRLPDGSEGVWLALANGTFIAAPLEAVTITVEAADD